MNLIADPRGAGVGRSGAAQVAGPRSTRLTMEPGRPGRSVCGSVARGAGRRAAPAAHLADEFGADAVQVLADGHVLVQYAGADRRLPRLHGLVAQPGPSS